MLYTVTAAARACGLPNSTLCQWLDRKIIKPGLDDVDEGTSGVPRQFTKRRVLQMALTSELVRIGLKAGDAAQAAAVFSDESQDGRAAGEVFAEGKTALIVDENGARCISVADRDAFESAMSTVYADTRTVIAVNVSEVIARVDRALAGSHKALPPAGAVYRHGRQMHIS